jgi:hypothetical protein
VTRLECEGIVIERCSNWCETTMNLAHALMHVGKGHEGWRVTIEAREMTSEAYDAMRAKFEDESVAEMIALDASAMLKEAVEGDK